MRLAYEAFEELLEFRKRGKRKYTVRKYRRARHAYISTLTFFFDVNHAYSKIFCATIVTYAPVNTMMTMWITLGYVDLERNGFIGFFIVYHLFFIFFLHFFSPIALEQFTGLGMCC